MKKLPQIEIGFSHEGVAYQIRLRRNSYLIDKGTQVTGGLSGNCIQWRTVEPTSLELWAACRALVAAKLPYNSLRARENALSLLCDNTLTCQSSYSWERSVRLKHAFYRGEQYVFN